MDSRFLLIARSYVSSKLGVQEGQLAARLHHSHNPKVRNVAPRHL